LNVRVKYNIKYKIVKLQLTSSLRVGTQTVNQSLNSYTINTWPCSTV